MMGGAGLLGVKVFWNSGCGEGLEKSSGWI